MMECIIEIQNNNETEVLIPVPRDKVMVAKQAMSDLSCRENSLGVNLRLLTLDYYKGVHILHLRGEYCSKPDPNMVVGLWWWSALPRSVAESISRIFDDEIKIEVLGQYLVISNVNYKVTRQKIKENDIKDLMFCHSKYQDLHWQALQEAPIATESNYASVAPQAAPAPIAPTPAHAPTPAPMMKAAAPVPTAIAAESAPAKASSSALEKQVFHAQQGIQKAQESKAIFATILEVKNEEKMELLIPVTLKNIEVAKDIVYKIWENNKMEDQVDRGKNILELEVYKGVTVVRLHLSKVESSENGKVLNCWFGIHYLHSMGILSRVFNEEVAIKVNYEMLGNVRNDTKLSISGFHRVVMCNKSQEEEYKTQFFSNEKYQVHNNAIPESSSCAVPATVASTTAPDPIKLAAPKPMASASVSEKQVSHAKQGIQKTKELKELFATMFGEDEITVDQLEALKALEDQVIKILGDVDAADQ